MLDDVCSTLFSGDIMNQVFEPQATFSMSFLKNMFTKISHTSIMKLNEQSMGKVILLFLLFEHNIELN